jgi:hypothetical protein
MIPTRGRCFIEPGRLTQSATEDPRGGALTSPKREACRPDKRGCLMCNRRPENLRPVDGVPHRRRCFQIVKDVVSDPSTEVARKAETRGIPPDRVRRPAVQVWNLRGNTLGSTAGRGCYRSHREAAHDEDDSFGLCVFGPGAIRSGPEYALSIAGAYSFHTRQFGWLLVARYH